MRGKCANSFKTRQGWPSATVCQSCQFPLFSQRRGLRRNVSGARPVPGVNWLACRFQRSGAISAEHPGTSAHFEVRSPPSRLRHRLSTGNSRSGS